MKRLPNYLRRRTPSEILDISPSCPTQVHGKKKFFPFESINYTILVICTENVKILTYIISIPYIIKILEILYIQKKFDKKEFGYSPTYVLACKLGYSQPSLKYAFKILIFSKVRFLFWRHPLLTDFETSFLPQTRLFK